MQSFLPAFEEAGVSLFVVFPETVEQLGAFAGEFDITLPLLADPESKVIKRLGILNTTLTEDDAPFYGIPFPGSYVLEADGTVRAKFFEQNSLIRAHPELLLQSATGGAVEPHDETPSGPPEMVEFEVQVDGDGLRAFLLRDLVVTFRVPSGQHLYGPPVADGLVATSVEIDRNDYVGTQDPIFPPTRSMTLQGTGEKLEVYEGDVQVRVPVIYNGTPVKDGDTVEVTGTVRWQACDDHACHIPRSEAFSITTTVGDPNVPGRLRR